MSVWPSLLESAIYSPSPHNVQPWRVRILNDTEADLFIDSARTLPKEDPTGSFIILTMGMFIEALRLLAAHRGLRLEHTEHHEPAWYAREIVTVSEQTFLPFARMRLVQDSSIRTPFNPDTFLKRRTSRISLKAEPIPKNVSEDLRALASDWQQRYEQITDPKTIERILAKNTDALFEDLNNTDYHDEIVTWFRFTDKASKKHRDGLDYRCMNTSRTAFWASAKLPWLLQTPISRQILAKVYRSQLGRIPTIGFLAGDFWEPESAFKTGSFLMQFWLALTKHNLYIHPYGNMVTNKQASQWLHAETGVPNIWLVFKIGYSDEPPKSYRRSLEEIMLA
ncbi:MAG TPA: hypothetical protein VIG25_09245 [Pyrinomonadaceae bacterium]|jgi:nitroreductase